MDGWMDGWMDEVLQFDLKTDSYLKTIQKRIIWTQIGQKKGKQGFFSSMVL